MKEYELVHLNGILLLITPEFSPANTNVLVYNKSTRKLLIWQIDYAFNSNNKPFTVLASNRWSHQFTTEYRNVPSIINLPLLPDIPTSRRTNDFTLAAIKQAQQVMLNNLKVAFTDDDYLVNVIKRNTIVEMPTKFATVRDFRFISKSEGRRELLEGHYIYEDGTVITA